MLDVTDARDALLGSRAVFDEWKQDFEQAWFGKDMQNKVLTALKLVMQQLSPEQVQELRRLDPDAFDEVIQMIGGTEDANRISLGAQEAGSRNEGFGGAQVRPETYSQSAGMG